MKAIAIETFGGPEVLKRTSRPVPEPQRGEVLIRVAAAGVNRPDIVQREGRYPPPAGASDLPGLEVAGAIAGLGDSVMGWRDGDAVCALVAGGGYAEYCVAPVETLLAVPKALSMVEAAALPETFFTVWSNVFDRGYLDATETLLVHGGSSGIGTTAILLAKAFDAKVIVTAGSDEKCAFCCDLGADLAINYKDQNFTEAVETFTQGRGADVILDMVGGDYVPRNIAAAAVGGRIVSIAFLNGKKAEIDIFTIMKKRLILTGSTLRPRSNSFKGAIAESLKNLVWPLLDHGEIRPVIDRTFPLEEAADAHRYMESARHMGKIVLTVS